MNASRQKQRWPMFQGYLCLWLVWSISGAGSLWAPKALAQASAASRREAHDLFLAAKKDFEARQFESAYKKLEQANNLFPEAMLVKNMARCLEELKQYQAAIDRYKEFLAMHPPPAHEAEAKAAIADLERRLKAELAVRVQAPRKKQMRIYTDPVPGYVWIDGRLYGPSPLPVELEAGNHTVRIEAEGYKEVEKTVELKADETMVHLTLTKIEAAAPAETVIREKGTSRWQRPWPWISLGVGLASLGVGIGQGAAHNDLDEFVKEGVSQSQLDVDYSRKMARRSNQRADTANYFFIGSAVFISAGIAMLVFWRDDPDAETTEPATSTTGASRNFKLQPLAAEQAFGLSGQLEF